jgi:hypothetical protein
MTLRSWVVVALIIAGIVVLYRGCAEPDAPDERLAEHFDAMCDIARKGIDSPEKGIRKLGRYVGKHLDDMLGDFGGTISTIEGIDDDERHDDRARTARDRIAAPLAACEADWERFADAVESDPDASAVLMRAIERLNRTLEILLSSKQLDFRDLPAQLRERFAR